MSFARKILVPLLILLMFLSACGSGLATSTPVDANSISTSLVGTLVASLFQTQTAQAVPPEQTSTPVPPAPINTITYPTVIYPSPTIAYFYPTLGTITPFLTPTVTGTVLTPTIDPDTLASGCNNLEFIRDVTVPDGTVFAPKEDFVKTWKVANIGTCKWEYQYEIVLISGSGFNAKTTKLNRVVEAGNWTEISLGMGAPKNPGDYTSDWRLADSNGIQFGSTLVVSFTVSTSPTNTPVPPTQTTAATSTPVPTSTTAPASTDTPTDTPTTSSSP
jgi:Ig-like domain from next to BRCA1 gene